MRLSGEELLQCERAWGWTYPAAVRMVLHRRWRVYADQLHAWERSLRGCSCNCCRYQAELRLDYDINGTRKQHGDEEG